MSKTAVSFFKILHAGQKTWLVKTSPVMCFRRRPVPENQIGRHLEKKVDIFQSVFENLLSSRENSRSTPDKNSTKLPLDSFKL